MELMGIKFAPLNIPLRRRLQTLAIAAWFSVFVFALFVGLYVSFYLIVHTRFWLITVAYLIWAWGIDKDTCERGGRRIEWVRAWSWWKYVKDYFPVNLKCVPCVTLDPNKNYLFCGFPHGVLSFGAFAAFATNAVGVNELFPDHKSIMITLTFNFYIPFFRELGYALGSCSASAKSINNLLSTPRGGNLVMLVVGGAAESFNCRPGQFRIKLKSRKGFVKLALRNGSPIVPVFSFGETDIYSQVDNPEGSILRNFQEFIRKITGIGLVFLKGRGFFQYSFGLLPLRKPINIVVGKPLDIEKIENPSQEDITAVHEKFVESLLDLFEEQKYNYLQDPESKNLIIE